MGVRKLHLVALLLHRVAIKNTFEGTRGKFGERRLILDKANTSKALRREVEEGQVRKEKVKENGPTHMKVKFSIPMRLM